MSSETGSAVERERSRSLPAVDPRSVRAIAKKDFQDAVRSWLFWGLSVFFFVLLVVLAGVISYFGRDLVAQGQATGVLDVFVILVSQITRLVVPVIALVLGWKSIAGERESGSIKILLSLPHSRTDVLLGKLIGRSAVLSVSLVVGFALAAGVVAALLGSFEVGFVADYVGLLVMSVVFGVTYVSIAVSLSSLTRSTTVAGAAMFGVFVLFYVVWNGLQQAFRLLAQRGILFFDTVPYTMEFQGQEVQAERLQDWVYFVLNLDPGQAYSNGLTLLTNVDALEQGASYSSQMFGGELPIFLQDWFSFLVLLAWIVVPLAVAIYRFDRVDL